MISRHLSDEELFAYVEGEEQRAAREADAHLSGCEECRSRLVSVRQFHDVLRDRAVHLFAAIRPPLVAFEASVEAALQAKLRIADEREAAEKTFSMLQSIPRDEWSDHLLEVPHARLVALLRHIIQEARNDFDRRPQNSLQLLDAAEKIASTLTDVFLALEQHGAIAKERAEALRMLGKHVDALAALDRAEAFIRQLPAPAFDLAFVDWVRATIFYSMTRFADGLPLARRAARVLRQHGEIERAEQVRVLEATLLCEQGNVAAARSVFTDLAIFFEAIGDRETVGRVYANLAECEVRLDNRELAYEYAADAARIFKELDIDAERIRVEWILGNALLRQGYLDEALEELRRAADAFDRIGMSADAADVRLDIAALHLTRGEWTEAEALARELSIRFASAETPVQQAQAFAYLREAVESRTATIALIEHVRSYLASATMENETRPFEPPN